MSKNKNSKSKTSDQLYDSNGRAITDPNYNRRRRRGTAKHRIAKARKNQG